MTTQAAAPAQEAPAVEPAEADASPETVLGDMFPGMGFDATEEEAEETKAEAASTEETESEEAEAKPAIDKSDPFKVFTDDALFSDKALATRDGIAKAREAILTARKHHREVLHDANDRHLKAKRHEESAKKNKLESDRIVKNVRAIESRLNADLELAFNGSPAEAAEALGRLAKRSGTEFYEQLTNAMLGAKKTNPRDKELEELKKWKEAQEARAREEEKEAHAESLIQKSWSVVKQEYATNLEEYPSIRALLATEHAAELNQYMDQRLRSQRWTDAATFLAVIEAVARKHAPKQQQQVKAETQKKNGKVPARGVSPSLSSGKGPTKNLDDLDQEERERLLEDDLPNVLASMGLEL